MKFAEKNLLGMLLFLILGAAAVGGLLFGVYSLVKSGTMGGCSGDPFAGTYKEINADEMRELICIKNEFELSKGVKGTITESEKKGDAVSTKNSTVSFLTEDGAFKFYQKETAGSVAETWYRDSYLYFSKTKTKTRSETFPNEITDSLNSKNILNSVVTEFAGYTKTYEADYNLKKGRITLTKETGEGDERVYDTIVFNFIVDANGYLCGLGIKEQTNQGGTEIESTQIYLRESVRITYPAVIDSYIEE